MNFLKKWKGLKILNNQRGSSLSITLIVITVLTFSITAITKTTVNLSSATTLELNAVNDESVAKGLIIEAISDFEAYIIDTNSYTDYNNVEIARVFQEYGIVVTDETDNLSDFGDRNGYLTKAYKFSYTLNNTDTISKYAYMSNNGSSLNTYYPFEYSLGTEGDLILNGGYYDDIKMFGKNIRLSGVSPWQEEWFTTNHYLSPYSSAVLPQMSWYGSDPSEVFYQDSYEYCTSNCFTVTRNGSSPYILNTGQYVDVEGSALSDQGDIQEDNITSFFGDFSFENFLVDYASNILPTDNRSITDSMDLSNFEDVIRDNMDTITYRRNGRSVRSYPSTPYVDITNDTNYRFEASNEYLRFAAVHDGDLTISKNVQMQDYDDEGFIILGDLTFDSRVSNRSLFIRGTFIVTGDLNIVGYNSDFNRATFIVLGETNVDYEYGYGMRTWSNNYELAIIGQDNIIFNDMHESYNTSTPNTTTMLLYSEESIWMDMVESKMVIEGAIFARAKGNSANPLFMEDDNGEQINGIVINSYKGYVNTRSGRDPQYVPNSNYRSHRFRLYAVDYNQFQNNFMNIPAFEGVVMTDGEYTLETSEWIKE